VNATTQYFDGPSAEVATVRVATQAGLAGRFAAALSSTKTAAGHVFVDGPMVNGPMHARGSHPTNKNDRPSVQTSHDI
jgi:hypothetical protein